MTYPYTVDFFLSPLWEGSGGGEVPLATVTDGTVRLPGSTVTFEDVRLASDGGELPGRVDRFALQRNARHVRPPVWSPGTV